MFGIIVIVWSTVLFLCFSNGFGEPGKKLYNQIAQLEDGIQEQFKSNSDIIKEARDFLEHKKQLKIEPVKKDEIASSLKDSVESQEGKLPILVFACNRVSVTRCLDKLLQYREDPDKFPIIVSQVSFDLFSNFIL